jgi:Glycosyl hydrolase family 26
MRRALLILLAATLLTACQQAPIVDAPVPVHAMHARYLGVSEPGNPLSMSNVRRFASLTGARVNLVSYYTGWYENFNAAAASAVTRYGALPLIFLDSGRVPLQDITGGTGHWATEYAKAVKKFGHPVAISFDSDFNGPWWPWSFEHESSQLYKAAWRRIVRIFRSVGATNVIWVWTVAKVSPITTPLAPWWPGSNYVNWVGVNAYYITSSSTFNNVFVPTFKRIRRLTNDPLLITETGANMEAGRPRAITNLFHHLGSVPGLLGFIYFDFSKNLFPLHKWRIDNDPAAIAAFKAAAASAGEGRRS